MTLTELKDCINLAFEASYTAQIYFVLKKEKDFVLRLADVESENSTEPELRKLFSDYIKKIILDNEELELCNLSVADERAGAIYHYDYDEYPEELALLQNFNIHTTNNNIRKFDFTNDDLSTLQGYIIYLGTMDNGMVLFKKHYPFLLIKRDTFLLGAIKSKKRFEKIKGEDIIRINEVTQLFRINENIFVIDIGVLERNLGFTELILKSAQNTIQAIDEIGLLDDIRVLSEASKELSFAKKLSKVKKSSPIFSLNISREAILKFTKSTPALSGKFKYNEKGNKIQLDTKKSKDAFIKLLNDSFLHSELTKQYYDAKAKDNITIPL